MSTGNQPIAAASFSGIVDSRTSVPENGESDMVLGKVETRFAAQMGYCLRYFGVRAAVAVRRGYCLRM
jgi:hypothetical protein